MRLSDLFNEIGIIKDKEKWKAYAKLLPENKIIKKNIKLSTLSELESFLDNINNKIIRFKMDKNLLINIKKYINDYGLKLKIDINAVNASINLINQYYNGEEIINIDEVIKENGKLIYIPVFGTTRSGKSTFISLLIPRIFRELFEIIKGVVETSTFNTRWFVLSKDCDLSNYKCVFYNKQLSGTEKINVCKNFVYIKPTFKCSDDIKNKLHNLLFNCIKMHNSYIYNSIKTNTTNYSDDLWDKSIQYSIEGILKDPEKIFMIEMLLGKFNMESEVYKIILKELDNFLINVQKLLIGDKVSSLNINDIKEDKFNFIKNKFNNKESLKNINEQYDVIFKNSEGSVENQIVEFLFGKYCKIIKKQFKINNLNENKQYISNEKMYTDIVANLREYTAFELPSREKNKNENLKLKENLKKILKVLYGDPKDINYKTQYLAPLIDNMDVILPYNEELFKDTSLKNNTNFCFIDSVGLNHGQKNSSEDIGRRFLSQVNSVESNCILLNINFSENISYLKEVFSYINNGYSGRILILTGYLDEYFKKICKDKFLNEFIESNDFVDKIENNIIQLSNEGKKYYEDTYDMGLFSIANLLKEDFDKILNFAIIKYFIQIFNDIKEKVKDDLKNLNINENQIIFMDKIDSIPVPDYIIDNYDNEMNLNSEKSLKRTLKSINEIYSFYNTDKKIKIDGIDFENDNLIKIDDKYLHIFIGKLLESYILQQIGIYESKDLHWNTLDTGIYKLKYNSVGHLYGVSYSICPGIDFIGNLLKILDEIYDGITFKERIFNFNLPNGIAIEDKLKLKDAFFVEFQKELNNVVHCYFVTDNVEIFEEIYDIRFDCKYIPMTNERKRRMISLIKSITDDTMKITLLILIAYKEAQRKIINKYIC